MKVIFYKTSYNAWWIWQPGVGYLAKDKTWNPNISTSSKPLDLFDFPSRETAEAFFREWMNEQTDEVFADYIAGKLL